MFLSSNIFCTSLFDCWKSYHLSLINDCCWVQKALFEELAEVMILVTCLPLNYITSHDPAKATSYLVYIASTWMPPAQTSWWPFPAQVYAVHQWGSLVHLSTEFFSTNLLVYPSWEADLIWMFHIVQIFIILKYNKMIYYLFNPLIISYLEKKGNGLSSVK